MRRIYVAGHRGLVGSAIVRAVESRNDTEWFGATRDEVDLFDHRAVVKFMDANRPDTVVIAAARVGGIGANSTYPVQFLTENLKIEMNLIEASHEIGVDKVLFLGSSCIYPRLAPQPIREEYLLTGELEPTNEPYALSKIAGIKLVQAYRTQYQRHWISAMPTNLYGPGDNFNPETSHVLPALLQRFHEAKVGNLQEVTLWGTGSPRREFLHVDDLAEACLYLIENYDGPVPINVGYGSDVTIKELAETIAEVVGFDGAMKWDTSKPDGTPRKLLDTSRINRLGWAPSISLADGIRSTYEWFCAQLTNGKNIRM